ncbi:hypothetical protein FPR49_12105 [Salmonella enterica]|nr:hypothetical protein [Salmonella enterica]
MKKTNIALLTATALIALTSASSYATVTTGSDQGQYLLNRVDSSVTATVKLTKPALTLSGTFVQNPTLTTEKSGVQNAGNITVTGLSDDRAYTLGNATITGADAAGYSDSAGVGFGWATAAENTISSASDIVANTDTYNDTAYVKINHLATAPVAGETTITIPVTSYTK